MQPRELQFKMAHRYTQYSPSPTTMSKLQLNDRTTIMRTTGNIAEWKSYIYGIKEEATMRLVGGAEIKLGWSHSTCGNKNQEGYLGCGGLPSGSGVPVPHQDSQPRLPVPGREACITSDCKNQWGPRLRETELLAISSKEPIHRLTWTHSLSVSMLRK